MKNIFLTIGILIMVFLVSGVEAESNKNLCVNDITDKQFNGNHWNKQNENWKLTYYRGFVNGLLQMNIFFMSRSLENTMQSFSKRWNSSNYDEKNKLEIIDDNTNEIFKTLMKQIQQTLPLFSSLLEGIKPVNKFYTNQKNLLIPIPSAIMLINRDMNGGFKSKKQKEKHIISLRKFAKKWHLNFK